MHINLHLLNIGTYTCSPCSTGLSDLLSPWWKRILRINAGMLSMGVSCSRFLICISMINGDTIKLVKALRPCQISHHDTINWITFSDLAALRRSRCEAWVVEVHQFRYAICAIKSHMRVCIIDAYLVRYHKQFIKIHGRWTLVKWD